MVDGHYDGIAAAQEWLADFWGNFQDVHTTIKDVVTGGDHVVIWAHLSGRGRSSGVHVDMENWQVFTIRGDKVTSYQLFDTKAEALEAAGLSE